MKTAQGCTDGGVALYALLNSQQFLMADLYTFTLSNGTVLRYTNWDGNLTVPYVGGNVFSSAGPGLQRGKTRTVIGVEVDKLVVNFLLNSSVLINRLPVAQFAAQGGFDGARLQLWRTFMPVGGTTGDTSAGYLIQFVGRIGEVQPSRSAAQVDVNSDLELLNIMLPRNLYQVTCVHSLFDAGCGLSKAAFASASSALAGSTAMLLNCGLAQAATFFDQGMVTFTGGANTGISRTIKGYMPGAVTLAYPLPNVPQAGDTFNAYPGCDKLQATCSSSKFNNLANFRGFPYIPVAETSY